MTRKQEIKERCEELANDTARVVGFAAWYEQSQKVLTEQEKQEVRELWYTMPGSTCWNDAFLKWVNQ